MAKHICIVSHQHLSRNPRVYKESISLKKISEKITILTSVYSSKLLEEDYELLKCRDIDYIFYNNLTVNDLRSYFNRASNKIGRLLNRIGIENRWALGYGVDKCLKTALSLNADLYICHQELPTYIGTRLLRKGKKVAFDLEDWYTEDLLPTAQKFRPQDILKRAERTALNLGTLAYTTSLPMAVAMAKAYKTDIPEVIYNSFESLPNSNDRNQSTYIRMIWLSQTIGPGRGLEKVVNVMNNIKATDIRLELNLRGMVTDEYRFQLSSYMTNRNHIINFLPPIPNNFIQHDLKNYDLGLATEPNYPLNKNLTLSNKMFHYLSVGLPVIATTTDGQLSLKKEFQDLIFYFENDDQLENIFTTLSLENLTSKREQINSIYKNSFAWNIIESKLQNLIQKVL